MLFTGITATINQHNEGYFLRYAVRTI